MRGRVACAVVVLSVLMLPLLARGKDEIIKIGPALSFGKYKDLSETDGLLTGAQPGAELAVRCAKRFEIWGSYKFSKTEYRMGHGSDRMFRLDAYSVGVRYKPVRFENGEPFIGAGLDYYHFADDSYTPFIFPVNSAVGPYVQGGFYIRIFSLLQIQCAAKYNLVRHTETRTTEWGSYHYRTDFSGLEFSVGLLLCVGGRQHEGAR
jgi:hypothetical protein